MRVHVDMCAVGLLISTLITPVSAQEHHMSAEERGAAVMGFDQHSTVHHFRLFEDGGSLEINALRDDDRANRDAIRSHLPHIATMFAAGQFDAPMLVHDSTHVPGTAAMAARKTVISYRYVETSAGGRLDIVTTDPEAVAAVHAFLKYQIAEHKTGDPLTVSRR